jgi:hypothetical protein
MRISEFEILKLIYRSEHRTHYSELYVVRGGSDDQ